MKVLNELTTAHSDKFRCEKIMNNTKYSMISNADSLTG